MYYVCVLYMARETLNKELYAFTCNHGNNKLTTIGNRTVKSAPKNNTEIFPIHLQCMLVYINHSSWHVHHIVLRERAEVADQLEQSTLEREVVQKVSDKQESFVIKDVVPVKKETEPAAPVPKDVAIIPTNLGTNQGKKSSLVTGNSKKGSGRKRAWRVVRYQKNGQKKKGNEAVNENQKQTKSERHYTKDSLLKPDEKLLQEWMAQDTVK